MIVDGKVLLRNKVFERLDKADVTARFKDSLARPLTEREINRGALSRQLMPSIEKWFSAWPLETGDPHYTYNLAD